MYAGAGEGRGVCGADREDQGLRSEPGAGRRRKCEQREEDEEDLCCLLCALLCCVSPQEGAPQDK